MNTPTERNACPPRRRDTSAKVLGQAAVDVAQSADDGTVLTRLAAAHAAGDKDRVFELVGRIQSLDAVAVQPPATYREDELQVGEGEDVLTIKELARELRVSTRTLWRALGSDKSFPKPFRAGRSLRWHRADVEKFKAQPNAHR